MSLEQVLSGAPENTEPVETPAEVPAETPVETPPPEQVEKPAETTAAKPERTVPLAALEDERRKRQELEQRLAQQTQPEKPGFWEQPEQHLQQVEQRAQAIAFKSKLDVFADMAAAKYQDLDQRIAEFDELVARTPGLWQQMMSARNPIEFAYSTAKNHAEYQAAGSVEGMRAKIESEMRAKIEAEFSAKAAAEAKKRDAIPQTLTDVPSGGAPREAEFTGPTPLNAILKR